MHTFAPMPASAGYPEQSIGRLMEEPIAVFLPTLTVGEATHTVRELAKSTRVFTYGYIVDATGVRADVVTMRDLLLQERGTRPDAFMLRNPYMLHAETENVEAMRQTVNKHYPAYPVCDAKGMLVGVVRGSKIFEAQAVEISAQAGAMVGVEKEERIA